MKSRLLSGTTSPILEIIEPISTLQDALDIVSASYEENTGNVLLRSELLPPEFFELKTKFAGEFVQKMVNYSLKIACVFDSQHAVSERFKEYIGEAKTGKQFRSFFL